MEEYLRQREQFIREDRALRPDRATASVLSSDERRADDILRSIRDTEAKDVWGQQTTLEHHHGSKQMFPGMEFLTGE